jgi:lysophospholipid acyltransferase
LSKPFKFLNKNKYKQKEVTLFNCLLWLQIWARTKDRLSPSPLLPTLIQAGICMGFYLNLVPHFPLSRFNEPEYQNWSFLHKLFYQYMSGFTARWKYYFIWSISEASVIISGLGFTGWTDSSPPKSKWDRAKNVDVLGVELARSSVQLPLVWNIQVSTWLRHCKFFFV